MLNLQHRIDLLSQLGKYIQDNDPDWQAIKHRASLVNGWFIPGFIDLAATNIAREFLSANELNRVADKYAVAPENAIPFTVGIVMAGNIPLVGFHDWLCVFLSGRKAMVKLSSKDNVLLPHLFEKLQEWAPGASDHTIVSDMLKGADAYIATGSDNSARYFDYYFARFPSIIRRNRSSTAILNGHETSAELEGLADDTHQYFGLGCRNITKIFTPFNYDFVPLLEAMRKYHYFADHAKYKNNYDYQLAIHLLNNQYYMTNDSVLLSESASLFSPISQLNYAYYSDKMTVLDELSNNNSVQCIVGKGLLPFGQAQHPAFEDFADGVNTMSFLQGLNN